MDRLFFFLLSLCPFLLNGQSGKTFWTTPLGSEGTFIHQTIEAPNGQIAMVGESIQEGRTDKDGYFVLLDPVNGIPISKGTVIDKPKDDVLFAITTTWDGGFVLAGYTESTDNGDREAWLIKLDEKGNVLWEEYYGEGGEDEFHFVLQEENGNLILAGTKNRQKDNDIWLVKIKQRQIILQENIGRRKFGQIRQFISLKQGGYALCGQGRRGNKVFFMTLTDQLKPRIEPVFLKVKAAYYEVHDFLETFDGKFAFVGMKRKTRMSDFDIGLLLSNREGKIELDENYGGVKDDLAFAIKQDNNANFVVFGHTLSHQSNVWKPRVEVLKISPKGKELDNIQPLNKNLKDESEIYISFLQDGNYALTTLIDEKEEPPVLSAKIPINTSGTRELIDVTLTYTHPIFKDNLEGNNNGILEPDERGYLFFKLRNESEFILPNVKVKIEEGQNFTGIDCSDWIETGTGQMEPFGELAFSIPIIAGSFLKETKAAFKIALIINNTKYKSFPAELTCQDDGGGVKQAYLKWIGEDTLMINVNDQKFLALNSSIFNRSKLQNKDIRLIINEVAAQQHKSNIEGVLKLKDAEDNFYDYDYQLNLLADSDLFKEGFNSLVLEFENELGDKVQSAPLLLHISRRKANLHILAIGPPHEDLKYTSKDAADFAAAFESQKGEGMLFNEVFITQLTTKEETTKGAIEEVIESFRDQSDRGAISKRDVMLVFISSHGKIMRDRFKIIPSDFKGKRYQTLDYEDEILNELEKVNGVKFVFIDACHSGSIPEGGKALGDESKIIGILAEQKEGITIITSCRKREYSYEHQDWENGAFTQAILEKLRVENTGFQENASSVSGLEYLNIKELFQYVQERVPSLVNEKIGKEQNPYKPLQQVEDNTPIYIFKSQTNEK